MQMSSSRHARLEKVWSGARRRSLGSFAIPTAAGRDGRRSGQVEQIRAGRQWERVVMVVEKTRQNTRHKTQKVKRSVRLSRWHTRVWWW